MKEKNDLNGYLIIDKPLDMGSTQVVNKLKYFLKPKKIGHAGTLDPLATGVLPIALGHATKTIQFVMDGEKTYRFEITFGAETTTDDLEGDITNTSDFLPTEAQIRAVLPDFIGKIKQVPPQYSAIKINGKRAYDLARKGQEAQMPEREVVISRLELLEYTAQKAVFEADCSKGTYIRALGRDIGRKIGCLGHISLLRRTKCGPFTLNHAILLDNFENNVYNASDLPLISILTALDDILVLAVDEKGVSDLKMGKALKSTPFMPFLKDSKEGDVLAFRFQDQLVALARYEAGLLKPFRVFAS